MGIKVISKRCLKCGGPAIYRFEDTTLKGQYICGDCLIKTALKTEIEVKECT